MSYEQIWSYYQTQTPEIFRGSAFRLNYLTRFLQSGERVLNVGIGGGLFEGFCREKGVDVFSMDPDWSSLHPHSAEGRSALIAGRLEGLPFADNTFDAVVVSEVLEHLTPQATREALLEILRVLAPWGQMIGTVPCEENLADGIVVCPKCREVFHKVAHLQSFSTKTMSELLGTVFGKVRCFERAFMAKTTVGKKESVVDLFRNQMVRTGIFTREKHLVFRAQKTNVEVNKRSTRLAYETRTNGGGRLAFFLPSLEGGGAERVMLNLAEEAAARGHSVDMVLARTGGALSSEVSGKMRLVNLGASRPLTAVPALVRYLCDERPRALLSTLTSANMAALLASRLTRNAVRCVVREASSLSIELKHSSPLNRVLLPILFRRSLMQADAVVAPSRGVADDLARVAGIPRSNIRVIYNPVVSERILEKSREPSSHRWLQGEDIPIIVGIGRLTRQKDFATLIRAFSLLQRRVPSRLIILGEGEDRASLDELCKRLGVGDIVDMPGFVPNPYAVLSRSALFVLSSRWEGLPGVLIEALACGTKVVATDCPSGPREILHDGLYGELCPVEDAAAMEEAMFRAMTGEFVAEDPKNWVNQFALKSRTDEYLTLLLG